ncbi:Achaete-scute transcription factor-related [Vigna unguiculata]|uniref:Achaete-scute transcription factor-related n=2 Tax=Vigna unguiculata TaxID=3917 RepID=A0A4D6LHD8_VIGUN|nr:Achaete-scute transcription factor-related [Vigna unguiculata]
MDQLGIQPSSTKVERRLVEKNRRNQMKILFNKLNSLLPSYNPKEALALPDQVDEAINYIKSLEAKVKMAEEKKESLQGSKKRYRGCFSNNNSANFAATPLPKSPQLEIQEVGSSLQVVLTTGIGNQFIFHQIIRMLHEENIEVRSAHSSLAGDSVLHVVHAEIPQSFLQFGATKVSERLKRFVNGSYSDVETQHEWWDFDIGSDDIWSF